MPTESFYIFETKEHEDGKASLYNETHSATSVLNVEAHQEFGAKRERKRILSNEGPW